MKVSLILACAGKGVRAGFEKNKLLITKDEKTVLEHTLSAFIDSKLIDQIIVSASKEDFDYIKSLLPKDALIVLGGNTRTQSVKNALELVSGDIVLIHDGARPYVSKKLIADCIECAKKYGSAIPVLPTRNTILKRKGALAEEYIGKDQLASVQTPQAFLSSSIKKAYSLIDNKTFNDDGEIYKEYIGELHVVDGEEQNIKLTFKEDFCFDDDKKFRFGVGFDCHRLVENRKLILGGINIPHDKGLLGHSDADVLTHAIMDAILSALALRDIGYHFSDKNPKYKDADSLGLLEKVLYMIKEKGYKVQSVSATIMAERPKLIGHIPNITNNLAKALDIDKSLVGISATTLEGLGFVGREEGICAYATATLIKI